MLRNSPVRLFRVVLLAAVCFTAMSANRAMCQLSGRIADRPIGVGYARDINQVTSFEYMQRLSKRLEVGKTMFERVPMDQLEGMRSGVDVPVNGASWFMVQGLIPTFETVYFKEVVDEADAKRLIDARKKMFGDRGTIETGDDGCYRFVNTNSWTTDVPKGQDPDEYVKSINNRNSGNRSYQNSAKLIEEDGKTRVEQSWTMSEYFRIHDNLLFSTSFEELWEMDLPTKDTLTSSISSTNDLGAEAFFDRIPMAMKQLGWNMLSATAGTQMQTRDDEQPVVADLRKKSLDVGLQIVRAVMFDVQESNGWVRFATDDEQSIRAELNFETRRNSGLTKQLENISSGGSRFAPILNDDAAGTLHFCFRLSEDSGDLPRAAAEWIKFAVADATNNDADMIAAATQVAESVGTYGDSRVLEAFAKAGWSEDTGGVFYGGLQVDENPNLLRGLVNLILNSDAPDIVKDAISLTEVDGSEVVKIRVPEPGVKEMAQFTSLKFDHVYVMHQNSCLWIAAGGEPAIGMLQKCIARCQESSRAVRVPLATAKVDVEKWLSYPQDDPTGIAGILTWLDANRYEFPPSPMSMATPFGRNRTDKPTPLLQRCLDLGGDRTAGFSLIADKSGVRASAHVGEAVGNYYLARMVDAQDSMMRRQRERQQEAMKEAEAVKELKEASE